MKLLGVYPWERRLGAWMERVAVFEQPVGDKGAGSNKAALAMAYGPVNAAQDRWRRCNGHELVADVIDGAKFKDAIKVTADETTRDERVAV